MKQRTIWDTSLASSLAPKNKVTMPEMLFGYMVGPFGAMLASGIFTSFLQAYLGDVLELSAGFLSALQLASTMLIVAANLVIGQLIERTKALAGKARPWILLSAMSLSVASILMFVVPFEGIARYIWIAVAYNIYYAVAYPIYSTANSTMIPVSTRDSEKRGVLASLTNVAGLGVMGAGSMVFPILVANVLTYEPANQIRWFICMLAVALFSVLTIYLQFRFTRERVTEETMEQASQEKSKTISMDEQLKAVTTEKWWWIIFGFYLLFQWSGAVKNGSMVYFCQQVLHDTTGAEQSLLAILGAIPMAVAAVFVVPLANKFGKKNITFIGMVIGFMGGILAGLGGDNMVLVGGGIALKCLGSSPACYMILAMIADVIDHIEFRRGIRTDGLTMSIYSSLMVAATPIGGAIIQALNAVMSIEVAASVNYIWIETVAYGICALLILRFNVEINLHDEQKAIAERKK